MKNNTTIKANPNKSNGLIDFYAECKGRRYYIFSRKYRTALYNYFKKGVLIGELFDYGRINGNQTIISTIEYMKTCLKSMEKEYRISFLGEKKQDKRHNYNRRIENRYKYYGYYDDIA